jgi:adenylate cyclase
MKRSLVVALLISLGLAVVFGAMYGLELFWGVQAAILAFFSHHRAGRSVVGLPWQLLIIVSLSFIVAWLTLTTRRRSRIALLALILVIELIGLTWIFSLYRIAFHPLPSVLAVALAFVVAERWAVLTTRSRSLLAQSFFGDRLSSDQIHRVIAGDIPLETEARAYEVSVVVCDIANKYDLADEADPTDFAETTESFIHRTRDLFIQADAYILAADGEGVVAVFGFPDTNGDHADQAVRVTLGMIDAFNKERQQNNGDLFGKCDIHMGVSSGNIVVAPLQGGSRSGLLTTGEPVELARRFCVANRFYGSRILIGPRTFELSSKQIVARPIDFLSGVNSQERHEIYEPLWLAAEANPEHIARRDSFWNGVVLYREKRWAEAYTEFQKAKGPDGEDDAPLQLYLRRLETLALHLTTAGE